MTFDLASDRPTSRPPIDSFVSAFSLSLELTLNSSITGFDRI